MTLRDKVLFITGASRGIGLAIALRAARDGASIAIAAKTAEPHPKLRGTIHSAAAEIVAAGGKALPLVVDVRDEIAVQRAVEETVERFGGIDICINNASAIQLTGTEATAVNRLDRMHAVNMRGTFVTTQACLPHLKRAANPHVLMISPPLDMRSDWFAPHVGYSIAKYGMSLCVLGMAAEFRDAGVAINALWPRTTIATSAVEFEFGGLDTFRRSRTPQIVADAAYSIVTKPSRSVTGQFMIDDEVLSADGMSTFDQYRVDASMPLMPDLFVSVDWPLPHGASWDPLLP